MATEWRLMVGLLACVHACKHIDYFLSRLNVVKNLVLRIGGTMETERLINSVSDDRTVTVEAYTWMTFLEYLK